LCPLCASTKNKNVRRIVTVEKIVEVPVEKIVEREKIVEVPVEKIVEVPVERYSAPSAHPKRSGPTSWATNVPTLVSLCAKNHIIHA